MKTMRLCKTNVLLAIVFCGFLVTFMLQKQIHLGLCSDSTIVVPDNYGKISWAIGNASYGDTILVKSGIYYEWDIVVDKAVRIVGENAENTILDGQELASSIFQVIADNVAIENLTLKNTATAAPPGPATIRVYNANAVAIKNVTTNNAASGVEIYSSNSTRIMYCKTSNCFSGIYIHYNSCNNIIVGNVIEENSNGIFIADASNQFNRIYHNNLINNTSHISIVGGENYFDNGYPSGGNYWDDYAGIDEFNGPYQNEIGSDGIFDQNHFGDNYPFVNPLTYLSIPIGDQIFIVQVSSNTTMTGCGFNVSKKTLDVFASGQVSIIGAVRVEIPQNLLTCEGDMNDWEISIYTSEFESQPLPQYLAKNDTENTYLFFSYNHTTANVRIEIKGTKVLLEMNAIGLMVLAITSSLALIASKELKRQRITHQAR